MPLLKPRKAGLFTELGSLRLLDSGKGTVTLGDVGSLITLDSDGDGSDDDTDEMSAKETASSAVESKGTSAPFRMLSASLLDGYFVDYSDPAIWTPDAVKCFDNKTIYMDHDCPVSQWIGIATGARLTTSTGVLGVDADFAIDPDQDEMWAKGSILRGMKLKPVPAIRSCSVGIAFESKPSHMFDSIWDFWMNLGSEVDGSIVRWIVTKINRVLEVSLVYAGADPGANSLSLSARSYIDQHRALQPVSPSEGEPSMSQTAYQLLLKAAKDCTGKDGDDAAPGLYALSERAKAAEQFQKDLVVANARIIELEAGVRQKLIHEGLTVKRNLSAVMVNNTVDAEGKVLAQSWANTVSLEALELHVKTAEALNTAAPKPQVQASMLITQPTAAPTMQVAGQAPRSAAHVAEIAATFKRTPEQVMENFAKRQIGGGV